MTTWSQKREGNGSRDARLTVWARSGTHDSTGEEGVEPGAEKTQPPFTGSSPGLRRQLSLSLSGIMSSVRSSTAQAAGTETGRLYGVFISTHSGRGKSCQWLVMPNYQVTSLVTLAGLGRTIKPIATNSIVTQYCIKVEWHCVHSFTVSLLPKYNVLPGLFARFRGTFVLICVG